MAYFPFFSTALFRAFGFTYPDNRDFPHTLYPQAAKMSMRISDLSPQMQKPQRYSCGFHKKRRGKMKKE